MKKPVLKSIIRTPGWLEAHDIQEDLLKVGVNFSRQRIGRIARILAEEGAIIRECVNSNKPKYRYMRIKLSP